MVAVEYVHLAEPDELSCRRSDLRKSNDLQSNNVKNAAYSGMCFVEKTRKKTDRCIDKQLFICRWNFCLLQRIEPKGAV
jgi:hypothetical protein